MLDEQRSSGVKRELENAATNASRAAEQLEAMLELTRLVHRERSARRSGRRVRRDETPAS